MQYLGCAQRTCRQQACSTYKCFKYYVQYILSLHDDPEIDPTEGKSIIGEYHVAPASRKAEFQVSSWQVPETGCAKINIDGSFVQATRFAGSGMILRDHMGEIVSCLCRCLQDCSSALERRIIFFYQRRSVSPRAVEPTPNIY